MREELLAGKIELPNKQKFLDNLSTNTVEVIEEMFHSLWYNYCSNKGSTSTIHWMGKCSSKAEFLGGLRALIQASWVTMDTRQNFSSISLNELKLLEFVSAEELEEVRFAKRFYKYLPYANTSEQDGMATVRTLGSSTNTKLSRPGMEVGAKSLFSFDRSALNKHFNRIKIEARKGIEETLAKHPQMNDDQANYAEVMDEIISHLATEDIVCNMGVNHVDSRGRAIKSHLSKVMNPIGFKVARALLVIPE
jgi:hypothetical protein